MTAPSHAGKHKFEVKPTSSKCAWCLQSSELNNFVLPLKEGTRFFCSLACLQEFKLYMCCGHCSAVTSCLDLSLRVTLNSSRKGFCSLECLEGFKTKIIKVNPAVTLITPPKQTWVDVEKEKVTPHSEFLAAVIKQEKNLIKTENMDIGEKELLSREQKPSPSESPYKSTTFVTSFTQSQRQKPTPAKSSYKLATCITSGQEQKSTPTKAPYKSTTYVSSFTQNDFSWENYLAETGSLAASHRCFNQNADPLTNEFAVGMKLESQDPRNCTSYCIASVIAVLGPRIRLRLDGSDDCNDFWKLVDADTIHPIGYCESKGKMLQAPLGFLKNPSFWASFMVKTLAGAYLAPEKCFKPGPKLPIYNFFSVGDKLEAVDRKNPHLICPATIVSVKNDEVQIHFDGWESVYGYWCRYDSRDLFPVGWCEKNDHPLQAPGPGKHKKTGVKRSISYDPSPSSSDEKKEENRRVKIKLEESITGSVYVNACCCGPYIMPKKFANIVPDVVGPGSFDHILQKIVQGFVDCSVKTKETFAILRKREYAGNSGSGAIIQGKVGREVQELHLPPMENIQELEEFLEIILEDLGCCKNLLSITAGTECLQCRPPSRTSLKAKERKEKHQGTPKKIKVEPGTQGF